MIEHRVNCHFGARCRTHRRKADDLKNPTPKTARFLAALLAVAAMATGALLLGGNHRGPDAEPGTLRDHASVLDEQTPDSLSRPQEGLVLAAADDAPGMPAIPAGMIEQEIAIGRDQSFYAALSERGAGHSSIMSLVKACKPYRNLRRVRGGDVFRIAIDDEGAIRRLCFDLRDGESFLAFEGLPDGRFKVHELSHPVERRTCAVSGTVDVSVYESLAAAGAPTALAAKMNDILGWEVDFRRDVRPGDAFTIIYEEVRRDTSFVRTGSILAMEYVNRGVAHRGFRFVDGEGKPGYFDGKGRNLEKQLMRAPLEYSRISSSFSHRRLHPVHKRYMPHLGIDYAAPVGTPVRAAGSGRIVEKAYDRSNGRYVKIQHTNQSYQTYYLHLSRFARGIKRGTRVTQGQVIGYVGATGTATGPHLDYRVKKDGTFVNPRTLKLPASAPVPAAERDAFQATVALYSYTMATLPGVSPPHRIAALLPLLASPQAAGGPVAVALLGGGISGPGAPAP